MVDDQPDQVGGKKHLPNSLAPLTRFFVKSVDHNSIAWVQDPTNGDPLVAFSGELPNIQLVNVATGVVNRVIDRLYILDSGLQ
jgi:hypothetical protein